jgi:hypothetical protein
MTETETALTKYVYIDIVGFTKGRSVEAQSDLVTNLNNIVHAALASKPLQTGETILLPTGDGICIALLGAKEFDIHLWLAVDLVAKILEYNEQTTDKMRHFKTRIGINENIDNVVIDINGNRNVAGMGISMAQRIMSLADGNQILIGQAVYEILSGREKYMKSLRRYEGSDKHGNKFPVYQFIAADCKGLNIDVPYFFKPREVKKEKLSKMVAYFMAHSLSSKPFLLSRREDASFIYNSIVLLYFKAYDSVLISEASQYETPHLITHGGSKATFVEQYDYYSKQDFWVMAKLREHIVETALQPFQRCFINS